MEESRDLNHLATVSVATIEIIDRELNQEEEINEIESTEGKETGENIATRNDLVDNITFKQRVHYVSLFSGFFLTCGLTSLLFLIPQHNVLEEPYYWYEYMLLEAFGWMPIVSALILLTSSYWANISYGINCPTFFIMVSIAVSSYMFSFATFSSIWIYGLHLFAPTPFVGYFSGTFTGMVLYVTLWFR